MLPEHSVPNPVALQVEGRGGGGFTLPAATASIEINDIAIKAETPTRVRTIQEYMSPTSSPV
jgi:hypothetical protein